MAHRICLSAQVRNIENIGQAAYDGWTSPLMNMPALELLVQVGLATVLGLAIGVERQWRSRMAGLQTMALVSMGSALYVILGAYGFDRDGDPTRWSPRSSPAWDFSARAPRCRPSSGMTLAWRTQSAR